MLSYGRLRSAFAFVFPLLLGFLYLLAGHFVFQHQKSQDAQKKTDDLLSRASILAARVKSEYSTSQQVEKAFRKVLEKVSAISDQREFAPDKELAGLIKAATPPQILEKTKIWAFTRNRDGFVLCSGEGFMNTKKRAMEKAFSSLISLADKHSDESGRRSSEKFITGLFGENSAPEYLATERLGLSTPVQFEGNPHYVYWQRFNRADECCGGFIALLPGQFVENTRDSLKRLAGELSQQTEADLLVSFAGSPVVDIKFAPIVASKHKTAYTEIPVAMSSLRELLYKSKTTPMRQLFRHGGWWHYIDQICLETHYLVAISGKSTVESNVSRSILPAAMTIFTALWSVIFFLRLRHNRFSLGIAFKMLFFMTGMLPVLTFIFLGFNLIEQSHEASIQQAIAHTFSQIEQIDERSEESVAQNGVTIKEFLAQIELHKGLISSDHGRRQQTFRNMENQLRQRGFFLKYLLIIRPGEIPEYHVSTPALLPYAKYHLEYYTVSAGALNRALTSHDPNLPQVALSASQKSLLASLGGSENPSAKDVFLSSLERINSFQAGTVYRHVFYSAILEDEGKISCYIILGMSVTEAVREIIKNQLNYINADPQRQYFCFGRDYSSGLKVFPAGHRFLGSNTGRHFCQFLESAASSMFRLEARRPDEIFIYEPLNKVKHYFGGAVISLSELNAQKNVKRVLLMAIAALLAGTIYLLASAVSSLMIQPARQLNRVFSEVAAGNYQQEFAYPFNNELGQLARATTQMIKGLKERKLLGKFVSTTFDAGVKFSHQHASGQEIDGTILFSDIRSFTTLSESHPPEEIGELLNTHLREMVEIIHKFSGRVEQFIGDAIVAFFPGESGISCQRAIQASTSMMSRHLSIQNERTLKGKETYAIGIGLDFGKVMAGILNSGSRSEFTIIGEARTMAEHCETASKTARFTRIIVTSRVAKSAPEISRLFENHGSGLFELKSLHNQT